jgi:hypothetical protein
MSRLVFLSLVLFAGLGAFASTARAECRRSTSGAFSADVRWSPMSGRACFSDVRAFDGPSCGGTPRFAITLGCDETRRMIVSDEGRLVSLLAARAVRRDREIVRVFTLDGDALAVRSVRLDELPIAGARPRLSLDARRLRASRARVPIATLERLGRDVARRRIR